MRTATGLTLMAIGAILTFAVTAHIGFLKIQVAGVVIMAVGLAGMLMARRGVQWRRRRVVLRRGTRGPVVSEVDETNFPSYVMIDPTSLQSVQPIPTEAADTEAVRDVPPDLEPKWAAGAAPAPATLVDEYIED